MLCHRDTPGHTTPTSLCMYMIVSDFSIEKYPALGGRHVLVRPLGEGGINNNNNNNNTIFAFAGKTGVTGVAFFFPSGLPSRFSVPLQPHSLCAASIPSGSRVVVT